MLCYDSSQSQGIHLYFLGIGTAGQYHGSLGAGHDIAVLAVHKMGQGLVDQVARMDIREEDHIRVTGDLTAGSALMLRRLGINVTSEPVFANRNLFME